MKLIKTFKNKIKLHVFLLIISGMCFGTMLQLRWFFRYCFDGDFRNYLDGCALFPVRLTIGGLAFAILFVLTWLFLKKLIIKWLPSRNEVEISYRISYSVSLFILGIPTVLLPDQYQKKYLLIIICITALTFIFSLKNDLIYVLKQLLKKPGYIHLFIGAVVIHFSIEFIMAIYEQGNILLIFERFNKYLFFNILIIFFIETIFNLLFNKVFFSIIITWYLSLLLIFSHLQKLKFMNLPLYVWDFKLINEAITIFPYIFQNAYFLLLMVFLTLFFIFVAFFSIKNSCRIKLKVRFLVTVSLMIFLSFWYRVSPDSSPAKLCAYFDSQFRNELRIKTGLYYFLFLTSKFSKYQYEPDLYNPEKIESLFDRYSDKVTNKKGFKPKVNVIIYLLESFFDPNNFGITYKNDPFPVIRSLLKNHPSGTFIAPVYGGLTANSEFEVLTGLSVTSHLSVFPPGASTYSQLPNKKIPSLPWIFREMNYYTLAINVVEKKFYNRNKAYPILGFENFISITEDVENPEKVHGIYSDNNIVDVIIDKTKNHFPAFIFAASFLTHADYNHSPINPDFEVLNSNISKHSQQNLQRFAHMVNLADKAIGRMIDHFSKSNEKTIIILFGDHLPGLKYVFDELKIFDESWPQNVLNRYSTPIVFWSNFNLPNEKIITSANFVHDYLFRYLGIHVNELQFNFGSKLRKVLPVSSNIFMDKNNNFLDFKNLSEEQLQMIEDYKLIQYDILKGDQLILNRQFFSLAGDLK